MTMIITDQEHEHSSSVDDEAGRFGAAWQSRSCPEERGISAGRERSHANPFFECRLTMPLATRQTAEVYQQGGLPVQEPQKPQHLLTRRYCR
jgi:hypothetical protein